MPEAQVCTGFPQIGNQGKTGVLSFNQGKTFKSGHRENSYRADVKIKNTCQTCVWCLPSALLRYLKGLGGEVYKGIK